MNAFYGCTGLTSLTIGNSVTNIASYAFSNCDSLNAVYYVGTPTNWSKIKIGSTNNSDFVFATRYYYSETKPTDTTYKYWHYVDGIPTPWENN